MDNKNNKDAFAGSKLGGGDKYLKRHQDAVKIERAEAVDKRIAEFYARKHDLNWAKEAIDFCERELVSGQDILEISKGLQDISRIKQEALDIILAEERRKEEEKEREKELEKIRLKELQQEQDRLKLIEEEQRLKLQQEQDRLRLIDEEEKLELQREQERLRLIAEEKRMEEEKLEDESVAIMEKMIDEVSNGERNRQWLKDLESLDLKLKGQVKRVYERISNRFIFESLKNEAKDVETAIDLDDEIIELNATRLKNKVWAEKVFDVENRMNKKFDKYMKERNTFFNMVNFATKIYYGEELTNVESIIVKVENGDVKNALKDYSIARKQVESLRNAIYIDEYIENFERRWKVASEEIEKLIKEFEKLETARKKAEKEEKDRIKKQKIEDEKKRIQKEKEEEERKLKLAQKKAKKQAKARKRNRILGFLFIHLIEILAIAGVIAYGVMNFDTVVGKYVLSIGSVAILCYIGIRQSFAFGKSLDPLRVAITTIINLGFFIVGIVAIFVPMLNVFAIPCFAGLIITSIFHMIMINMWKYGGDVDDNSFNYLWMNLGIIALALAFIKFIPGIIGFVVCAGILIVGSIVSIVIMLLSDGLEDALMYFVGAAMMIAGCVFAWFMNWNFIILGGGLFIAGNVYCYGNSDLADDCSPFTIFIMIVGIIFFGMGACITSVM